MMVYCSLCAVLLHILFEVDQIIFLDTVNRWKYYLPLRQGLGIDKYNPRVEQISELYRGASSAGMRLAVVTDFHRSPKMTPRGWFREAMVLDLACTDSALILSQASASRGFNYRHSWILLHNSSNDRPVIEATLSDYDILPDADVVWSSVDSLVEVYKVKLGQPLLQTNLGLNRSCSREDLLALWGALPSVVARRKDLRNVSMKGVSVISAPENFRSWSDVRDRQTDPLPKSTYPLMMLAAQDMNFRFNLRQVDLYGTSQNGSFDGMTGILQRQEAELAVVAEFFRLDRMKVIDYYTETFGLSGAFIFRQPPRSAVSNVFLAPFTGEVWAAIGGLAVLAALLLVALRRVRERTRPSRELVELTLPDTCTFALGTLCQQGFHITPPVTSVRVVMFSTLMASLFVFTAYSAKIVAILQTPSNALHTIDDLTRSPMTIGVQETTYKKVYFVESSEKSTQKLYRHKILPQGERAFHSVADGIARVRAGYFAFQVELSSGYDVITKTFTEREKCSLKEIEAFKFPNTGLSMKKHSGYKELLAVRIRWLREVGIMRRFHRIWMPSRPRCEESGGGFVSVGIVDILPALQALALGALIAGLLLAVELGVHLINRKTKTFKIHNKCNDKILHGDTNRWK